MTARIVSAEEARGLLAPLEPGETWTYHRGTDPELDPRRAERPWVETVPSGAPDDGGDIVALFYRWDDGRGRLAATAPDLARTVIALEGERDAALARVARLEADNAALWRDLHAASEGVAKRNARMQTQLDRVFPVESREVEARIADLVSVVLDCETANMATHRHVPRPILAMQRKVERLEREAADAATSTPTPPADSKAPR